jgi:hypothetical protein
MNFPDHTCPFCRELGQPCSLGHALDQYYRTVRAKRTCDEGITAIRAEGWSIGETGGPGGWIVTGTRGEQEIHAAGATQSAAWAEAVQQAESMPLIVDESCSFTIPDAI